MRLQVIYTETLESELNPRQGGHSFGLVPTLVLVPTKADPVTKERGCKWGLANGVQLEPMALAVPK